MYTWHESVLRPSDSRCYESVLHRLKCGGGAEDERNSADCGVSPWCAGHTRTLWCRDRKLASSACVDEYMLGWFFVHNVQQRHRTLRHLVRSQWTT